VKIEIGKLLKLETRKKGSTMGILRGNQSSLGKACVSCGYSLDGLSYCSLLP